jgi:hypothetical protein
MAVVQRAAVCARAHFKLLLAVVPVPRIAAHRVIQAVEEQIGRDRCVHRELPRREVFVCRDVRCRNDDLHIFGVGAISRSSIHGYCGMR